jgi:hypothetical protein
MEEVSAACASTGVIMSVNNSLVCDPLVKFATEAAEAAVAAPAGPRRQARLLHAERAERGQRRGGAEDPGGARTATAT